jgi:1-phosphofructokinase family hexose kinase
MILTVTLNPCLDKSLFVPRNVPIETLRPGRVVDLAGGKGVNVARALAGLGEPAEALLPLGGHPGAETADLARHEGLQPIVVPISGRTRIALTIREESTGSYWHYLEPGPEWDEADSDRLRQAYYAAVARSELVAISGSLPCAGAETVLAWMVETGRALGRRVAVDSHGAGLRAGLAARPWLVKPNREELAAFLDSALDDPDAAWKAVRELADAGAAVVLLSAGSGPLLASWEGEEWEALPPPVELVNALGSGDSLLAGVLAAVRRGLPPAEALRWGVACGAANAAVWDPGGIRRDEVARLAPGVIVRRATAARQSRRPSPLSAGASPAFDPN